MRLALISGLLTQSRPIAIVWLVVPIVVPPLDGIHRPLLRSSCWPFSHVRKEVCEFLPPLAHGNTAATVVAIVGKLGIRASLNQVIPCLIFSSTRAPVPLSSAGPTVTCVARCEVVAQGNGRPPAGAEAGPFHMSGPFQSAGPHRCEAPKGLSGDVSVSHGDIAYITGGCNG